MGYESRLYVVDKNNKTTHDFNGKEIDLGEEINGKKMYYANFICEFDLSKCYIISDIMRNYPATDSYIFNDEGNMEIVEDKYGEPLKEIPIEDAVNIIERAEKEEHYRRYAPVLAALKALNEDKDHWNELVVLHYGY